jgi:tetratricopeptide (TPR) repeat protein
LILTIKKHSSNPCKKYSKQAKRPLTSSEEKAREAREAAAKQEKRLILTRLSSLSLAAAMSRQSMVGKYLTVNSVVENAEAYCYRGRCYMQM